MCLGIAGPDPTPALPGAQTLADDLHGFHASPLAYLSVRSGTPVAFVERINREVNAVLGAPEVRTRLAELGIAVNPSTPDDIARHVEREREKWRKVFEASGAKLE